MKLITFETVLWSLEDTTRQVEVPAGVAPKARKAVERMLELSDGNSRSYCVTGPSADCHVTESFLKTRSGFLINTLVPAGTDSVSQTLPPTTELAPMTVSPPRIVAPA